MRESHVKTELAIIILNWNAAEDTMRCIRDILAWEQLRPTIWIVDNASAKDDIAAIARAYPEARIIRNEVNLGFSGGVNRGIQAALQAGDVPILLLNNDALIDESSVIHMLHTLQASDDIGFVGPLLFDADEAHTFISAGAKNPVLHHQTRIDTFPRAEQQEVATMSGTAILIRPAVFKTVGLLDEAYFFSTELADLCRRARQSAGYRCIIDARARAYHRIRRSARYRSALYPYYIIRNRFLYIRKFYHALPRLWLIGFWASYSLALSVKLWLTGETATRRAVWLGLVDGLQGRFGGQNERVLRSDSGRKAKNARQ
jgi:GT2 family glycosyltransferase